MSEHYPIAMTLEELMAEARRISQVDIHDQEAIEPLGVLLHALNHDSRLHKEGAVAMQNKILRLLSNRLRMQRDFAAHPEISDEKIEQVVFILGMARSGTTKTHRVLSSTGDFNYMPFWQVQYPALISGDRNESPQTRIDAAEAYCRWLDATVPESKLGHNFETHLAEEDSLLTEQCLIAPSFFAYSEVDSYSAWFAELGSAGMVSNFEFLKNVLKYLQWQGLASADKPWVLKAPTYYGFEPELLKVFPDANIVMTHRTPLSTVPSICKLLDYFHAPFDSARLDPAALQSGLAGLLNLHLQNRKTTPGLNMLDIAFEDAVANVEAVVKRIYQHAGIPLSEQALENVRQWDNNNPIHSKGKFEYSLDEFGLTAEGIEKEMSDYIEFVSKLPRLA
jgi:hypothetical protein